MIYLDNIIQNIVEEDKAKYDVEELGQVFTPEGYVEEMMEMRTNQGRTLEPSAGDGAFWRKIEGDKVGIEIDKRHCPEGCLNIDFFEYPITEKFDTIIGNPPYVGFKSICETTRALLSQQVADYFDNRTNLYLFFIEKCFRHLNDGGELIFITPRDFIKATSAMKLNELLYENGTITHFKDLGDTNIFKGYTPNCAIWRYVKGDKTYKTKLRYGKTVDFQMKNGLLYFTNEKYEIPFSDLFSVKVGAVSGMDKVFVHENGNKEFVCSSTRTDGKLQRMFYNCCFDHEHILKHKQELINRKIKKFDESNWWTWGRGYVSNNEPRVYVNCKTRVKDPFFAHPCRDYDGAVLAIFFKGPLADKCKSGEMTEQEIANKLNKVNWEELGFKVGGRFVFAQRNLEETFLPEKLFK